MKKRMLSLVLAFIMVITMIPVSAVKAAETESYPFTSIMSADGKYSLTAKIVKGTVNVWGSDIPTYQVAVPEGIQSVDVTFPKGEAFQTYTQGYKPSDGSVDWSGSNVTVKNNGDGTVTVTIPITKYTDKDSGIILEDSSYQAKYGFDFVVNKELVFPVNVTLDDTIYGNDSGSNMRDNYIKQIKIDGATVRDYQLGSVYKENSSKAENMHWYRNIEIYLTDDVADDAELKVEYVLANTDSLAIKKDDIDVADNKTKVALVNGEATWNLTTTGSNYTNYYHLTPKRFYKITVSKKTVEQVEEANKKAAEDVDALIETIGEVVYTKECKEKIAEARMNYDLLPKTVKKLVTKYDDLEEAEEALELLKVTKVELKYNLKGGDVLDKPEVLSEGTHIHSRTYWYKINEDNTTSPLQEGTKAEFDTSYLLEIYFAPDEGLEFAKGKYIEMTYNGKEIGYLSSIQGVRDAFSENSITRLIAHIEIYVPKAEMYGIVDYEDAVFENGTKVSEMGLAETAELKVEGGNIQIPITWDIDELPYDFTSTKEQKFTIYGTISKDDIPDYVDYKEEYSLTRAFNVTVKAAEKQNKADEVTAKIKLLEKIDLDSKTEIEAARAAYEALTEEEKKLVEGYDKLVLAENLYKVLEKQAELDKTDDGNVAKINALKNVVALTASKVRKVKVASQSGNAVTFTWTAVENADNYLVKILKNGKTVDTINTTATTYTYKNAPAGYAYTAVVTPTITYEGVKYAGLEAKAAVTKQLAAPSIKVKKSGSKVKITAKKRSCTGYQVQISKKSTFSSKKNYRVKGKTLSKSVKVSALNKGKNYVRVRAYTTYNGKTVYSKWSKTKTVKK